MKKFLTFCLTASVALVAVQLHAQCANCAAGKAPVFNQAQSYVAPVYSAPVQQYAAPVEYAVPSTSYVAPIYSEPVTTYAQPSYIQSVYQPSGCSSCQMSSIPMGCNGGGCSEGGCGQAIVYQGGCGACGSSWSGCGAIVPGMIINGETVVAGSIVDQPAAQDGSQTVTSPAGGDNSVPPEPTPVPETDGSDASQNSEAGTPSSDDAGDVPAAPVAEGDET